MLVTQVSILYHGSEDHFLERRGNVRIQLHGRHWIAVQYGFSDQRASLPSEGSLPRGHFVKHYPQGKQISASVNLFSAHLLWRHIRSRARNNAFDGNRFLLGRVFRNMSGPHLGQSKIQDLHPQMADDENVSGFYVPVDDPLSVSRL